MSLLLERAKRERLRWDKNPNIRSTYLQRTPKAFIPVAAVSPAKTAKGFWKKYFPYSKKMKSRLTNDEPPVENSQVTAAFLIHQLGMVAVEEADAVIHPRSATIKDANTDNALEASSMHSSGDFVAKELNNNILSTPLTLSAGLQNEPQLEPQLEPLDPIIFSPEDQVRLSIDSNVSNITSQAPSSISLVGTKASTPPSAQGKIHSYTEIVDDVAPTRLFHDQRNRPEAPNIEFALLPEGISTCDTQQSTDDSNGVQDVQPRDAAEVVQSSCTMSLGEGEASDAEKPTTTQENDIPDSTVVGAMLDAPEDIESNQVIKRSHRGKKLRKRIRGTKVVKSNRKRFQGRIDAAASSVREDVELKIASLLKIVSKLRRYNKALASQSSKNYIEWQHAKNRVADYTYSLEHEDPDTVTEANNVTKKLQEKYQLLEEKNKEQIMELQREFDDYVHSHKGEVDAVQTRLHKAQEETAYAEQCKDDYKQQLDDALFHQGLHLQDQQIISAFQKKETTLIQDKENMSQLLGDEMKKLHEVGLEVTELRLSRRDAERKLEEAQDKINQLISANELLEARAEPIDFLGFPSGQQYEMDQKDQKLNEMADELRCAKETTAKIAKANGDDTMAVILDSHAHKVDMLTVMIQTKNDEISELQQKLSAQQNAQERDEYYGIHMQEDMEELQIQYNAVSKDLRELREQLAKGNHTLADPKSWLHMKECSEGREQAIHRQKKAEEQLEGCQQLQVDLQNHVCDVWRRVCGFEELMAPSECHLYLTEGRDELVARTLELCNVDVNDGDPQELAQMVADDMQKFGYYHGPHGTPANWLPSAQIQAAAGNRAQASANGSASIQATQGSVSGQAHDCNNEGKAAGSLCINSEWTMSPAVQEHINELSYYSRKHHELIICLWGQMWEFEDIVAPEQCDERVWKNRLRLVKETEEFTGFEVNAIYPEDEALMEGRAHRPLHTPAHWMPVNLDDGKN
ncbi:MAG: hypothetical protein Q9195_009144, partial [Heterodermia aff. obscurata]